MTSIRRIALTRVLTQAGNPATWSRLDAFLKAHHDDVLGLISYTSVLICELIKNFPKIKHLLHKLLYRLRLVRKPAPATPEPLSQRAQNIAETFNGIYGYIVDIRIAQGIFYIVPYIAQFLTDYNTPSKLKTAFSSWQGVDNFLTFFLFGNYQWLENLAFILSHDFLPADTDLFLLEKHKKDKSLSASDWYYVYSCALWCAWNVIANLKLLRKGQVDFNLLCDLILSYHWALPAGFLDRPTFAIVGFLNTVTRFKDLL